MLTLCSVYKSKKKPDSYLYSSEKDSLDHVPIELLEMFGAPIFVMTFPISKRTKLGYADIESVRESLEKQGYYLQLPPL